MIPDFKLHLLGSNPIDDPKQFDTWLSEQIQDRTPLAIDTETIGLEWWRPNFTRMVQIGNQSEGWAIPVSWYGKVIDHALSRITESRLPVIMHNAKFDMHALESDGFTVPSWETVHDTMVLHHLVSPHKSHALKSIGRELLGEWATWGQAALKDVMSRNKWTWGTVPVDNKYYWGYAVMDTIMTRKIFDELYEHDTIKKAAYEREMAYTAVMYRAERRGLLIDDKYCRDLRSEWTVTMENLSLCLQNAGIKNPSSGPQVEAALRDLGWTPEDFTDTGHAQLDKPVLSRLIEAGGALGTHASQLLEYRRLRKWTSTYLDTFLSNQDSEGRVHPSIRTMGARTGRSSVTDPPLQTLPHTPHIRRAVVPDEGNVLCTADYSGQEYRILASYSGDDAWLHEFRHGSGDPHRMVADMLGVSRDQAKTFNFAMVYGAGPKRLAEGTGLSEAEVKGFLRHYKQRFPLVDVFLSNVERAGGVRLANDGEAFVQTRGGRKVVANPDQLYALTNYLIQGSGADVLKEATCRLDAVGLGDYILLPVHDELLFEFPEGEYDTLSKEVEDVMTNNNWFTLPIVAEADGPYKNWGEKYV